MIAVDTSASMAILPDEPEAAACAEAFVTNDRIHGQGGAKRLRRYGL